MDFPDKYTALTENLYSYEEYSIVPVRYEDRYDIMKWRNEQIYHLRQAKPLTKEDQDHYFKKIVSGLFEQQQPNQILFSYLKNEKCIGYGGLVHINWIDKNAEISFIMATEQEEKEFEKYWSNFLNLIEKVAFQDLKLHKIFTYAFDLRPHLYHVLEDNSYIREATLKDHCIFNNLYKDVVIHTKIFPYLSVRKIENRDKKITYEWANDEVTRKNSFNTNPIQYEDHEQWFSKKLTDSNAYYLICEVDGTSAGLVRFDLNDTGATIGILVDKQFRGKGLATVFLKEACILFRQGFSQPIFAFIKEENLASVKSFGKAGFDRVEKTMINNVEAVKYEYGK